jgi:hypothetical protein
MQLVILLGLVIFKTSSSGCVVVFLDQKSYYTNDIENAFIIPVIVLFRRISQSLTLKEAIDKGVENYGTIKAKQKYAQASQETMKQSQRDYCV